MTFFDQKAIFNEILSMGRRFNVFFEENWQIDVQKGNILENFFFEKLFLNLIFKFFAAPHELRTSRMREVREYPLRHWELGLEHGLELGWGKLALDLELRGKGGGVPWELRAGSDHGKWVRVSGW